MAATPIKHSGEVIRIDGNRVYVQMSVDSACSGCHARMVCGVDESKDKVVEVVTSLAHDYQVGDSVEVALRQKSMGTISVMLAYVVPFFVLTFLLVFQNKMLLSLNKLFEILVSYFLQLLNKYTLLSLQQL